MTAKELFHEASRRGLRLEPKGDKLAVTPANRCPPDFAAVLREHKGELLAWLSQAPCPRWGVVPPDNLPLDPLKPCPTLENRDRVIGYFLHQGCDRPGGQLSAWFASRACAYYVGMGRHCDCALHAYAAARDGASWQLNCTESALWGLLAASSQRICDSDEGRSRELAATHRKAHNP